MLKRNGVFLTVLFALGVTISSVSYTFYQLYQTNQTKHNDNMFGKYALISQIYHTFLLRQISLPIFETNLAMYDLYAIEHEDEYREITENATVLKQNGVAAIEMHRKISPKSPYQNLIVNHIHASMLEYEGKIYFWIQSAHYPVLLEDRSSKAYDAHNLLYSYVTILTILLLSFGLIIHRLSPLRRLRRKIALFGEGNMGVSFHIRGEDEIALVARELETTQKKIRALIDSRTLFLRNIMHELKTPIAKGRIVTTMVTDLKQQARFQSIFERLEGLITEFALIEEVSSGSQSLEKKSPFRLVDIIDEAVDMAMIDPESIEREVEGSVMIEANFRLFATAIKNMIDNAIKYSPTSTMFIRVEEDMIVFSNYGEALKKPLAYYVEPFTKDHPTKDSFGLGLYIVNAILIEHGYCLAYERRKDENCFLFIPEKRTNLRGKVHKNEKNINNQ
ncbi:MAG: ArsS family sensor histidine kinase [Sulfuricurvum sp.]|nr:ArsS family sensor histidine kinase [Sulfuricurvum sp.]